MVMSCYLHNISPQRDFIYFSITACYKYQSLLFVFYPDCVG